MSNICQECGLDMDFVGKAHRCVSQPKQFTKPLTKQFTKPSTDRVKKWRKNNKDKYNAYQKEYMREYQRKRRAKLKTA